jgi:hypothetical protein
MKSVIFSCITDSNHYTTEATYIKDSKGEFFKTNKKVQHFFIIIIIIIVNMVKV